MCLSVPYRPFKSSITFVDNAGAYLERLSGVPLYSMLLDLRANIILGWKGMLETNILADLDPSSVTKKNVSQHWPQAAPSTTMDPPKGLSRCQFNKLFTCTTYSHSKMIW